MRSGCASKGSHLQCHIAGDPLRLLVRVGLDAPEGMLQPISLGRLRRGARGLLPALFRLPPLLSKPAAVLSSFFPVVDGAATPAVAWPPSLQAGHKRCSMVKLSVLALNGRLSRRSACVCYQGHRERYTACPNVGVDPTPYSLTDCRGLCFINSRPRAATRAPRSVRARIQFANGAKHQAPRVRARGSRPTQRAREYRI